jgi:two-component system response regulator HydG
VKNLISDSTKSAPKILLVDDDPGFGRIMIKFAERANLDLTYCYSVKDLEHLYLPNYQVAIIDYELQNISGIQLLQTIAKSGNLIPTVLVSSYSRPAIPAWEVQIIKFIHKSVGPVGILFETLKAYQDLGREAA